ncbi:hypothetical protein N7456_002551 [Penicillium angulare]|uniref:Uncharacterized protein n=1 Tax=Penicillium angulare TaxID=116970 RepID=A0A9W9KQB0_9EURO|nr:hypothetical protein N7456_002551 [Penicillium angulare]
MALENNTLTPKRQRSKRRIYPEPDPYVGETENDANERERRGRFAGGCRKRRLQKSDLVIEIQPSASLEKESAGCSDIVTESRQSSADASTIVKEEQTSPTTDDNIQRQNDLLKRQLHFLARHKDENTRSLERENKRLQDETDRLYRQQYWERGSNEERQDSNSGSGTIIETLKKELEHREKEAEEWRWKLSSLQRQFNSASELTSILRDLQNTNITSTAFATELSRLQYMVSRLATFFTRFISIHRVMNFRKRPARAAGLDALVKMGVGSSVALSKNPKQALCGMLFTFIQDRIFYSERWKSQHFEGHMIRGYQELLQNIGSDPRKGLPGTIEAFHKAAIEGMLKDNHQFKDKWIGSQVEDMQAELLSLFHPILDTEEMERIEKELPNHLNPLLNSAFNFRARCVPPSSSRYELLHFKKGDKFDPEYMQVEEFDGVNVPLSEESPYHERIMRCTHGCFVEHPVDPSSGHDSMQTLAKPFVYFARQSLNAGGRAMGQLKSGKAIVVLKKMAEPKVSPDTERMNSIDTRSKWKRLSRRRRLTRMDH